MIQPFALRYSWAIRWLLSPIGLGPVHSGADVYHGFVRVRMGWAFHSDIPRASITAARIYPGVIRWTAGAHTNQSVVLTFDANLGNPEQAGRSLDNVAVITK